MTTPNEPDQDRGDTHQTADESTQQSGTPPQGGQQSGTQRGALVPPWQRGTGQTSAVSGGPQRPSGAGTAAASMSGQQAPVTKLDDAPTEARSPRPFGAEDRADSVDSPTTHFDRTQLPSDEVPDLDEIHQTQQSAEREPERAAAGPRSAPAQVNAGSGALRAAVQIRRIDPWATFKISAVLSVAGFLIWMIAVAVLYLVLDGMGVRDQLNNSFGTLITEEGTSSDLVGPGAVFGVAVLLGVVNAVLITALATVGSYIYNLCADMVGGAEVTLADLD